MAFDDLISMTIEMQHLDDTQVLALAAGGDFDAFEVLVNRYQNRIMGLAFRMVGQREDAEDVTQKTLLSLVEHIDTFRGESSVATWILRIATNHALKVLRQRKTTREVSLAPDSDESYGSLEHPEFIADWRDNPETLVQNNEVKNLVERELAELDDKHRPVFVLRDIEGFTVKETAELLGISEANVKVRLLRARLKLRERLTRAFGDEARRVIPDHSHGADSHKRV
jgi:RNA polymerase sigma-70 factor (ECF subfamily)